MNSANYNKISSLFQEMKDNALSQDRKEEVLEAIMPILEAVEKGEMRAVENYDAITRSPQQFSAEIELCKASVLVKQAILLYFNVNQSRFDPYHHSYDKIPLRFRTQQECEEAKIRVVSGSIVRRFAYIGPQVILMPSFVNVGAYIGSGTMIDTWVTVGSCAQIGKNCHLSGGVGIGGVLEPLDANPVVIEDDVFIGARSEVVNGVRIGKGSVLAMGVYLGPSTKIVHRHTKEIIYGYVPEYSVVVPGSHEGLYCAVIIKQVDEKTRKQVAINNLLRD